MCKLKNDKKGITLIALIITIIVLLILAGVSISMIVGNDGIMSKAEEAVDETNKASQKEIEDTKNLEDLINNYDENSGNTGNEEETIEYGNIEIIVMLQGSIQDVQFCSLFEVIGKINDDVVYSNIVPIYLNEAGTKKQVVDNIPLNANVTVTQLYVTPSYGCTSNKIQTSVSTSETVENDDVFFDFIEESNESYQIEGKVLTSNLKYNEISKNYDWKDATMLAKTSKIIPIAFGGGGIVNNNIELEQEYNSSALEVSATNDESPVYLRSRVFTPSGVECDILYDSGWKLSDNMYYKSGILNPEENCNLVNIQNIRCNNKYMNEFNIAVIVEYVGVSYDEDGQPYEKWN